MLVSLTKVKKNLKTLEESRLTVVILDKIHKKSLCCFAEA